VDAASQIKFTIYNLNMAHARRSGDRYALCGAYVWISFKRAETLVPMLPLCEDCEELLKKETHAL
jgi:hypothetical protein